MKKIQQKLSKYATNDIWNAEEYGLFYNLLPRSTIGPTRLPGRKNRSNAQPFWCALMETELKNIRLVDLFRLKSLVALKERT